MMEQDGTPLGAARKRSSYNKKQSASAIWRRKMGLTQIEAASALGLSRRQIQAFEAEEKALPRLVELAMLGYEVETGKLGKLLSFGRMPPVLTSYNAR